MLGCHGGQRGRSRAWATLLALALGVSGVPGAGVPDAGARESFEWIAPAGCPTAVAVRRSLAELIDVERARWDRFESIRGRVSSSGRGWELELRFSSGATTNARRFTVRDCAALLDLAAVTLALALDPEALELPAGEERADADSALGEALALPPPGKAPLAVSAGAATGTPPPSDELDERSGAARSSSRTSLPPVAARLGVAGLLDPTTLGAVSFGASLWGDVQRGRFSLGVYGDWLPSGSVEVAARSVDFSLLSGGVRGCYVPTLGLGLCPQFEVGVLGASGSELDDGSTTRDLWLAPGASVELAVPALQQLSVLTRISLLVPLVRGHYLVNGSEPLHRTPPLTLRLALGIALTVL